MRWEINSKHLTPEIIHQFKLMAVERGMTHGELLAELVTRKVENNG